MPGSRVTAPRARFTYTSSNVQGGGMVIDVGDVPVLLRTADSLLLDLLESRFQSFVNASAVPQFEFDVTVVPSWADEDADLELRRDGARWSMRRGDFRAEWNAVDRRGWIRQTRSPYAVDSVLRIVHTLLLSRAGGFLLHASSVIRDGRAFLFAGPSGVGKTTIVSHAPAGASVLTDEISYVKRVDDQYVAYGTPFAGDLGKPGVSVRAPVAALFRLAHGSENHKERLALPQVVRTLMRNILFFAHDDELVSRVLETACHFADCVPTYSLTFTPDETAWELIQ